MERVVAGAPRHAQHESHDDDGDAHREEGEKQERLIQQNDLMNIYLQFIDLGEENDIRCLCEALKYYEHPLS